MDKNLPTTLPANFNFNAGGSAQAAPAAPAMLPADFNFNNPAPTDTNISGNESHPVSDFISSALEATPFPKFLASARKAALGINDLANSYQPSDLNIVGQGFKKLFSKNLSTSEQEELMNDSYNVLPNGKGVKPISNNPLDAMGTGASMASYITPLGPETAGGNWALNLLKMSAPFAVTQTLGGVLTDAADGKSGKATLGDAAMNYLGSVAGFGIFKGLASGLKMVSGALLKSDVVKAANQAVLDFMGHALSLDGRFAQDGANVTAKDAALMQRSLEQSYEPVHKQAMDAFAQSVQSPTTWDDVYRGVQKKVSGLFDNMVKAKDAKYASVFRDDFFPTPSNASEYAKPTFDALERAKTAVGGPSAPVGGKMSVDEARAFIASGAADKADSPLAKYADLIQSKLGTPETPNTLSMKDYDTLFTSAPVSHDPIENKGIQDLATSVYESAHQALSKSTDPEAAKIMQSWDEARTQWMNLRNMAGTKFMNNVKGIGDAQAFVEKMMSSKPTVSTQKIIDGLDADTKRQMSDIIYNMALQRSRTMNADYSVGGEAVEKMLDSWTPTGLITPQHEAILRSYSTAMQGTYDDAAKTISGLVGAGSSAEDAISGVTSDAMKAKNALTTAADAQAKAGAAADITKAMGGKPLYTKNADGTFDFTNLTKMVDKINNGGEYDALAQHLSQVEDLSQTSASKVGSVVKGVLGATMFHQHPFVGLGLISSSLEKLFGKDAAKVTSADISRLTTDLIKTGRLTPDKTSQFLIHIIRGDFQEAGGILAKLVTGAVNKTATDTINPTNE